MLSGRRRARVFALVIFLWVPPALFATFYQGSPLLEGFRRLAGSRAPEAGRISQEQLRDILAQADGRLPPRREVALWIEPMTTDLAELVSHAAAWITASYLLYPRRVFPLSMPEAIRELESRHLIAPPVARLMTARATALARHDLSPALGILVWDRPPPCEIESLRAWSARLLVTFPQGGCLFSAGRDDG